LAELIEAAQIRVECRRI